jgi:hypothetical protein
VLLIDQNESFLSDLESYSSLMFNRNEIAVIMEVDPAELSELLRETQSPAFRAFQRGRLKREAELRKGIFDLAQNGSSPAQTMAIKLIENAKAEDL